MTNTETSEQMYTLLQGKDITDCIEIISNLLINVGSDYLPFYCNSNPTELIQSVIDYRKQNGETLATAIVMQGLSMMVWLDNGKSVV